MEGFKPIFDPALLQAPLTKRKDAFARVRLKHRMLDDVVSLVLRYLQSDSDRNIIAILGPSGVGKTALLRSLERRILADYAERMLSDPSFIPCGYVELAAATASAYNFDDFLYRAVHVLKDPFAGAWSSDVIAARAAQNADQTEFWAALRASTHLRFSFEAAVRFRKPVALLIDEINHVLKTARDRTSLDQCNAMKSFANLTATQLIVAGTEAAIELFEGDGQIGRRVPVVPFHAYSSSDHDRREYFTVACNFLARMPVKTIDADVFDEPYLFAGGVGSVGTLRGWLCHGFSHCLSDTPDRFQRKHLDASRHKTQVLHKLLDNIGMARERLKDGNFQDVMTRLGLDGSALPEEPADGTEQPPNSKPSDSSDEPKPKPKRKQRVGHRKRSNDPIGLQPGDLDVAG